MTNPSYSLYLKVAMPLVPKDQQQNLLLMADNEALASQLYAIYADRFPQRKALWQNLSTEEKNHEKWLREIELLTVSGDVFLNDKRFNREPITGLTKHIKDLINKAENVTDVEALSCALDLEQSLIERRYFEIIESDNPKIKKVLNDLELETENHKSMLWKLWEETRPKI